MLNHGSIMLGGNIAITTGFTTFIKNVGDKVSLMDMFLS